MKTGHFPWDFPIAKQSPASAAPARAVIPNSRGEIIALFFKNAETYWGPIHHVLNSWPNSKIMYMSVSADPGRRKGECARE
jgi:hypothetical protein